MGRLTYKNLYIQVAEEIEKRIAHRGIDKYGNQLGRTSVSPFLMTGGALSDVSVAELVEAIDTILKEALPQNILEGLNVTETDPISNKITIEAGKGSIGASVYTLDEDITITVPFDTTTKVFYVNLYQDRIMLDKIEDPNKLKIAKIIVPDPGSTNRVKDDKDDDFPNDAYIVGFKQFKLYGNKAGKFEEDTLELLRDNISPVLADNLIGNIRLNEDLKIINTAGTIQIDSTAMKIFDEDENVMAKFNRRGVFFYDVAGREISRYTDTDAHIGNIIINKDGLQSRDYSSGVSGFIIQDRGDAEFNDVTVRGTIYATTGEIGGFTINSNMLYATTTGIIQTGANVGEGQNGVKLDYNGLHVYDDVLGRVVYFPSDGSTPEISSGTISEVIYEISTNAVMRTSSAVGDGTSSSYGVLINNTGLYGCEANQLLKDANFKILSADGTVKLKGEIEADTGEIGGVTIDSTGLYGGLIVGAIIRGGIYESSSSLPKIRIDSTGIYYQVTGSTGKYGASSGGGTNYYGSGTKYGAGVQAYLFSPNYPTFSVLVEDTSFADIRLYNRTSDPTTGTHALGDLIVVSGILKRCSVAGSPGTFVVVGEGASTALDNLASVAINTSLISDTDDTDDVGSVDKEWRNIYIDGIAYLDAIDMEGNIDFNKNQTIAMAIENVTSDPASPATGQIWFRTDL